MRITKKTVRAMVFVLVLAAGAGWRWGLPWVAGLKEKSPESFESLKENIKTLHWLEAGRLAWRLHSLSAEEALALRYRSWKDQLAASPEFEARARENERLAREESGGQRGDAHRRALEGLAAGETAAAVRAPALGRREPWEFSVALRDQCRKQLELQWRARSESGGKAADAGASDAAGKCAFWVPLSDDERVVHRALFALRDKMDYSYYLRLLDALGVSSEEVLKFEERLRRMTGSFSPA